MGRRAGAEGDGGGHAQQHEEQQGHALRDGEGRFGVGGRGGVQRDDLAEGLGDGDEDQEVEADHHAAGIDPAPEGAVAYLAAGEEHRRQDDQGDDGDDDGGHRVVARIRGA